MAPPTRPDVAPLSPSGAPIRVRNGTMGKVVTAASAALAAGTAAGVTHTVLTRWYTNMALRTAIVSFRQTNAELGGAVKGSTLPSVDKESIKTAIDNIKDKFPGFFVLTGSRKQKLEDIKDQVEVIKSKLNGQLQEMAQKMEQTYSDLKYASGKADNSRIYIQSGAAAAAVAGVTFGGSLSADSIQTAIEKYLYGSSSGDVDPCNSEC